MNEILKAISAVLETSCLFLLIVCAAALLAVVVAPILRRKWQQANGGAIVVAAAFAIVAIIAGGTKPNHVTAGADEGLALVSVVVDYDPTNDLTAVEVRFTGAGITTATPVSVRNFDTEGWTGLAKIDATTTSDLPTNVLAFAVSGNVAAYRYWWVGENTPATIVETAGIEITHFLATSQSVEIGWTCDDPNATEFEVQRRRKGTVEWATVAVCDTFGYAYWGFTVGESWEWRVIATYAGDAQ